MLGHALPQWLRIFNPAPTPHRCHARTKSWLRFCRLRRMASLRKTASLSKSGFAKNAFSSPFALTGFVFADCAGWLRCAKPQVSVNPARKNAFSSPFALTGFVFADCAGWLRCAKPRVSVNLVSQKTPFLRLLRQTRALPSQRQRSLPVGVGASLTTTGNPSEPRPSGSAIKTSPPATRFTPCKRLSFL